MKAILLNVLPPFLMHSPSLSHSSIKSYLEKESIKADIYYWNLSLKRAIERFVNLYSFMQDSHFYRLLPAQAIHAVEMEDKEALQRIKYLILSLKPEYRIKGELFVEMYIRSSVAYIRSVIEEEIDKLDMEQYELIGFQHYHSQWIWGAYIQKCIKKRYPHLPIVVGMIGSRQEACAVLANFPQTDYVIWGEGEEALKALYLTIKRSKNDFSTIPRLAYRKDGKIMTTTTVCHYADLDNYPYPDYSDYFHQVKGVELTEELFLPMEQSRGCNWNHCHFCSLNTGYKYRKKSIEHVMAEIEYQVATTGIRRFYFSDYNFFGTNFEELERLLNFFIDYKRRYPQFEITSIEVASHGITYEVMKKLALAGFGLVHYGYESPSDNLLKKINKVNSFADNFFFTKWAHHLKLPTESFQTIMNLAEETDDDLYEAIDNLHYYRFILDNTRYYHTYSTLLVGCTSPYNKGLKAGNYPFKKQNNTFEATYLPALFIREEDKEAFFFWTVSPENTLWDNFKSVEQHYRNTDYRYTVYPLSDGCLYVEKIGENELFRLELNKESVAYKVLCETNKEICSLDKLSERIPAKSQDIIRETVTWLQEKGLVYASFDMKEIVSVIIIEK